MRYQVQKSDGISGPPIPPDEPCLVIRAQDVFASVMLEIYLALYRDLHADDRDRGVIADLIDHLKVMRQWQADNPSKLKIADR
jgi:hypothetical protein